VTDLVHGRAALYHEALALLEFRRLLADPIFAGTGVADGDGQPVLVIPGFLAPDLAMKTMVGWLRRTGHYAAYPRLGPNMRCGEDAVIRLERRLEGLAARRGRRVVVIGHSRGGQLARVLGVRRPDLVSLVVLLGTPVMDFTALNPLVNVWIRGLGILARAGVPGLMGSACFTGPCCEQFRADASGPFPSDVTLVCVVGRRDAMVDRRACADADATAVVDVNATHIGTVLNPDTFRAIARAIATSCDPDAAGAGSSLAA
jgi:pimeloyl-ACP methyl ester carboxylesterase